ncbi:MAG TPA: transaldolase [Acidimicrobiia bacterium]|nr:transaldolase [Acidimicrobiia bacterium]
MSNLHAVAAAGQSVWSDQISRRMLDSGELARRIDEDAVTGVTSNPSIFAKAIVGSDDYADQLDELIGRDAGTKEIVGALMTSDLQRACEALLPVWESTGGRDGHVSVEVDPELAHETDQSIAEAREWVKRIDRPNLLVKIPATRAGIPAIAALIGEGISVNVTLIFSLERYREVMDAYMTGLETYRSVGGDLASVASVASFFVSRVDTEVDARLDEIGGEEAEELRGKVAIANALAAYDDFLHTFRGLRWEALAIGGARIQRPLWASTSTKDPAYPDTMYVDALVAPHTVNTMPLETIDAYQDHGAARPDIFGPAEMSRARVTLRRLADVGVDYDDVVQRLEDEGVDKFIGSWRDLLDDIEAQR